MQKGAEAGKWAKGGKADYVRVHMYAVRIIF